MEYKMNEIKKITELSIGNWVSYNNHPCKVVNIKPSYIDLADGDNIHNDVTIDKIEAIFLTEDILQNNGFKLDEKKSKEYDQLIYFKQFGYDEMFVCSGKYDKSLWSVMVDNPGVGCTLLKSCATFVHYLQNSIISFDAELHIEL